MKTKKKRLLKKLIYLLVSLFILGLLFTSALVIYTLKNLPSLDLLENHQIPESTKIYDRTGETLIFELYGEQKRTIIPLDEIPDLIEQATVAIEDSEFYNHSGLNFKALLRAVIENARSGWGSQGGSTITQQLAKNVFLSPEKTASRKFKEVLLTYQLEKKFSKDKILELYLNEIPYGGTTYGIQAASETFFSKSVEDLSLAEIALLVSLPQAPSYYSPWGSHVDALLARKNQVLSRMFTLGYIDEETMNSAKKETLKFNRLANLEIAPHFVLETKEYLDKKYGEEFVRRSGLKVVTTLDVELQQIAEEVVSAGAERNERLYNGSNAALVAQDPRTGQILAIVGSRNYFDEEIDGQFNVATQWLRKPGSALKTFAYLTALKTGYPEQTLLFDVETEFSTNLQQSYKPQNFDDYFRGPVNFRTALSQSINIPAVKTLYLVGIDNLLSTLKDFGINTLNDPRRYGLSLVLGGGEVHLTDLVGAYSTLAQEGNRHAQQTILRIEDRDGNILESYTDQIARVIDPEYPRIINDILSDVKARSGLFQSSLGMTIFPGHDVALKTGTTNDYRDAWSVGYTPNLVVGIWAGNNDNTPMQAQGGSILAAIPMLSAFLSKALPSQTPASFPAPTGSIVNKPMLNGEYIANFVSNRRIYPQVHNILYYVNRDNPTGPMPSNPAQNSQFKSWEEGVLSWASRNIAGFISGLNYNLPLPANATLKRIIPEPEVLPDEEEDESEEVIIIPEIN